MIKVERLIVSPLESNSYIVYDDISNDAVVIDLGGDFDVVYNRVKSLKLNLQAVLLTHGHFDHASGAVYCKDNGIPVYISKEDYYMLSCDDNLAIPFSFKPAYFNADNVLDADRLVFGKIVINVIKTPGHTIGSVCFLIDDFLFCGDTLFYMSYGRTDFPSGDFKMLKNSIINKIFTMSGDIVLYPGHGDSTTINFERKYNPINEDNY